MKNQKTQKGITLVALVITIIILLILAGISISQLTENGLFEKAKISKEKSKDAQEKENTTLAEYENKTGEYVEGTRETNSIKMHSPIILVNASLPYTNKESRTAGTYNASSSEYTKTNSEQMSNYLEFTENVGWKVLKEGLYHIKVDANHEYVDTWGYMYTRLLLNSKAFETFTRGVLNQYYPQAANDVANTTLYLNKEDIIDFQFDARVLGRYSSADFTIYAMFE